VPTDGLWLPLDETVTSVRRRFTQLTDTQSACPSEGTLGRPGPTVNALVLLMQANDLLFCASSALNRGGRVGSAPKDPAPHFVKNCSSCAA
jgi:hypothetical protein